MMRILIVEDEIIIAEDLRLTLQSFGHEIISVVSSGEEAINYTDNFSPDMIFMDIVLEGDINGIEAAMLIKKKARYTNNILLCIRRYGNQKCYFEIRTEHIHF